MNLAGIAKTQGDIAGAIEHLEAAVDMGRRSARVVTVRQALLNLANLDLYVGRLARACASMDALAEQRGDLPPHQLAQFLALEAEYASRSGDTIRVVRRSGAQCAEATTPSGGRSIWARSPGSSAALMLAADEGTDAQVLVREVERAASVLASTTAHRALLSLARGKVLALHHDEARARVAFDEACSIATASDQKDWDSGALEVRAQLGRRRQARPSARAAIASLR